MSNEKIKKLFAYARLVRLSDKEKADFRYALESHIRYTKAKTTKQKKSTLSPWQYFANTITFALIVFVVSTGTLAYAAQDSLPGEFLYPIKTEITEKIEEGLALTTETKLKVQTKRVNRRVEEALTLVEGNKFSPENQIIIEDQISIDMVKLSENIDILKGEGKIEKALEATSTLQPTLQVQKEQLEDITETNDKPVSTFTASISEIDEVIQTNQAVELIRKIDNALVQLDKKEVEIFEVIEASENNINLQSFETQALSKYKETSSRFKKTAERFNDFVEKNQNVEKIEIVFEELETPSVSTEEEILEIDALSAERTEFEFEEATEDSLEDELSDDLEMLMIELEKDFKKIEGETDIYLNELNLENSGKLLEESLVAYKNKKFKLSIEKSNEAKKLIEKINSYLSIQEKEATDKTKEVINSACVDCAIDEIKEGEEEENKVEVSTTETSEGFTIDFPVEYIELEINEEA
jgi:hypothetical protein